MLKYNRNDIKFDFVAMGYSRSNKNQYAYKLEVFNEAPVDFSIARS